MPDSAFLGMRSTADFTVEGQRPRNWRETILRLYPNGKAPLTALLALMKNEATNDPMFNWFSKKLPEQAATVTGMFSDANLSADITSNLSKGSSVWAKMTEADARQFTPNHTVLLRNVDDVTFDTVGIVENVSQAGAASFLKIKLIEDSHGVLSTANIGRVLIVGSANAEGALIGQAVSYDPYRRYNYTQIFRNPLEITRTAEKTYLRTGPAYKEAKREALELHSIEMEKAFLFGVPSENEGANGKPLRTTGGLIWATKSFGGVVESFAGADWMTDGLDWLDATLMRLFRWGSQDKLAFVGDSALMAINKLARDKGTWNYTTTTKAFGIQVVELQTPFGALSLKTHPLFSYEPTNRKSMLIFEPKNLKYRYITDTTFFLDDERHGHNRYDGKKEEYLSECGLEYHFPEGFAWLNNVGGDAV